MSDIAQTISERLKKVQTRIRDAVQTADRSLNDVQLLAVSKTKPAEDIWQAYQAGQRDFGENYLQEALEKQAQLVQRYPDNEICWHFIGPIQSNKTRAIAQHFSWVHSVDRVKIAQRLSEQRPDDLPPLNICLQLNLDGEESKSGFRPEALSEHATQISALPNLAVRGLMAIPKPRDDFPGQLASLQRLQQLRSELQTAGVHLDTLSMGMSNDLEAAVAAGSTMLRVGSDIFGPREPKPQSPSDQH
ncbi:YggS family pyridoxal phosphate-dependent enzyme [Pseudoteredinibacter isoporae]|uniref:YggS family pyridoxal phosphate-dependent enzyme n=1 Tax=Pseudoteredinibacter isoporae TaxID=570281 RepID=UPI0031035C5C